MVQEKLLVRLSGTAADILNELVRRGYFATKSEAIRAGILRLGENFGLLKPSMHYWRELDEEIKRTGKQMTHEEIMEALTRLEQEA
jgi:Arc/MetJ-type ribon-helix-helix transcriptional regulator